MANGQEGTNNFDAVAKLLTGAVAIVITATGTIGAASGGFAFLLRNAKDPVTCSLVIAAGAALLAGLATVLPKNPNSLNWAWGRRVGLFFSSTLLLFVSLGILLSAQVNLQGTSARPVVTTEWTTNGLKVSAEADSLSKNDVLSINVTGQDSKTNPKQKQTFGFYLGSTGPDEDGKAKQQVTVTLNAPATFHTDGVFVVAAVIDRGTAQQRALADCDGKVFTLNSDGSLSPLANHPPVATACLIFTIEPTPQPSATPK